MYNKEHAEHLMEQFADRISGGAFAYKESGKHELLFANNNVVQLCECSDYEDFFKFTGESFDGMIAEASKEAVIREISSEIHSLNKNAGYLFFNIRTKRGGVLPVEAHWKNVFDAEEGNVVYVFLVSREFEGTENGIDPVTGLMGKSKLKRHVEELFEKTGRSDRTHYAIVYFNFVNFKFLNVTLGVEEGDKCLKCMSEIMDEVYGKGFVSRLSDDHFAVFAKFEDIHIKTREVKTKFDKLYGDNYGVSLKCGIYKFRLDEKFDFESALSFAKMACDYIKYDAKADIVDYSEGIAKSMIISEYVVKNIDTAISEEWLKVYYQPVVRTLTKVVCGAESLVRWIDPEVGFLAPNMFIETLEKNRLIHKLDCFVVTKVLRDIRERMDKGLPVVPVSVNFSRLDFIMCDMLDFVEKERKKYDIPTDYIHVEITESMIASDEELMKNVIAEFREAGYEVWMDDFGSGYSSLMLLKDYVFDVVKFDMRFLTPFTEKAKDILRNLVSMCKDIGIRTLAEGVENKEEVDFLHSIGCGRIQGYYYGKPEPVEDFFAHAKEKELAIEPHEDMKFYDAACLHIRPTEEPLEIIEDDGENIHTLFMNDSYKKQIFSDLPDIEEADRRIYHTDSPLVKKYRLYIDSLEETGKPGEFFYTVGGNIMHFVGEVIARSGGRNILRGRIDNLNLDKNKVEGSNLSNKLRELNQLFDVVHLINVSEGTFTPLLGKYKYLDGKADEGADIKAVFDSFEERIFASEKKKFRNYSDISALAKRLKESEDGYLNEIFGVRQENGDYRLEEIFLLPVSGSRGNEFLFCMKYYMKAELNPYVIDMNGEARDEYAKLWDNLIWNSHLKFYWKDKSFKYRGVSQAFLDFFGYESPAEVMGKTDRDLDLVVDIDSYEKGEKRIINSGGKMINEPIECKAGGKNVMTILSEIPVYDDGKLVGTVGFFTTEGDVIGF